MPSFMKEYEFKHNDLMFICDGYSIWIGRDIIGAWHKSCIGRDASAIISSATRQSSLCSAAHDLMDITPAR